LASRYESVIELGGSAIEMADGLGLDDVRAQALITMGPARMRDGDLEGIADLRAGVELARRIGSSELARGLINLAVAEAQLGNARWTIEVHEEAGRVAEKMGKHFDRRYVRGGRAGWLYVVGRWDETLAAANAFIEEAEEAPHYLENANRRVRAMIRFARGDTEGALADAHRAAELGRRARDPQAVFPSLSVLAELLLEEGRVDEARAAAEELATRAKAGERPGFPPRGSTVFALVTLIGAQRVLELVADGPATSSKDAAIAIVDGELVVAADIYSLHGDVVSEAATRMRAAEKLLAEGNRRDADAQLQKALAFYRSVGATRYVREGEALLAASA
jgi:ATP/maltotriose-dependent transcriptional regulator MalT